MDPNNQNPQGDNGAVNKLEQDLQNIKEQAAVTQPQPENTQPAVPEMQSVPQVPEVTPVVAPPPAPTTVATETNNFVPESPKKNSPLLIIAIILAVVAVLAVVAYVFGAKLFSPTPKEVSCTQEAKICPDGTDVGRTGPNCEFAACPTASATPVVTLVSTASPSASPTVIPTASASAKPTSTPTSSPTATP